MKINVLVVIGVMVVVAGILVASGVVSIPLSVYLDKEYYGWSGTVTDDSITLTKVLYYLPSSDVLSQSDIYKYMFDEPAETLTVTFRANLTTCDQSLTYTDWMNQVYDVSVGSFKCIYEYVFTGKWSNGTPVSVNFINRNFNEIIGPKNIIHRNVKPWFALLVDLYSYVENNCECVYGRICIKKVEFRIDPWSFKAVYHAYTSPQQNIVACYSAGYIVRKANVSSWYTIVNVGNESEVSEGTFTVTATKTITYTIPTTTTYTVTSTTTVTQTITSTTSIPQYVEKPINISQARNNTVLVGLLIMICGVVMTVIGLRRAGTAVVKL